MLNMNYEYSHFNVEKLLNIVEKVVMKKMSFADIRCFVDHVSVRMALKFGDVTISHTNITFYDCKAVGRLNATSP